MKQTAGKKQAARRFWLAVHLYLGLWLGLLLSVAGLTGSLLVFYIELDEWLNPELAVNQSSLDRQSYEMIFQSLLGAEPHRQHAWRLEIPEHPQRMITARYYKPEETEHQGFAPLLVSVDPYSGAVVAKRFWGQFAMTWLYDLHYTLLLDQGGKIAMAIVGLLLIVSLISGVYLWWPPLHKLRSALSFKKSASPERLNYDLHKTGGVYNLIVLAMLAVTGIALEIPEYINPAIGFFSPLHKPPKPESSPASNGKRISLDQAVAIAQRQFPEARLCWIETPDGEKGSYRINLRQAGEPSRRFPKTNVWIDQFSGHILAIGDPKQHTTGDSIIAWLHPLHSGEAILMPGRMLVFAAGLACPLLFVTGVIRWRHKRRNKISRRIAKKR
ncbi:MAG: PepSY domain-containing protein [Methylococcaceae bacterium]|nr:PepSY domain-containing protein [Methylococcaceae bacterium]